MKKKMMMLLTTVALVMGLTACGESAVSTGNDVASGSGVESPDEISPESTAEPVQVVVSRLSRTTSTFVNEEFFASCQAGIEACASYGISHNNMNTFGVKSIGDICTVTEYIYDADGNRISESSSGIDPFEFAYCGSLDTQNVYTEFDAAGNIKLQTICNKHASDISNTILEYDAEGRVTKEVSADKNNYPLATHVYTYDDKGNVVEDALLAEGSDTPYIQKYEYEYDAADRVTKKIAERETWEYTYDDTGKIAEAHVYDRDGVLEYLVEYLYDEDGNNVITKKTRSGDVSTTFYINDVRVSRTESYKAELMEVFNGSQADGIMSGSHAEGTGVFVDRVEVEKFILGATKLYESCTDDGVLQSEEGFNFNYYGVLKCVREQDAAGNIIKESWCDENGKTIIETVYEYVDMTITVPAQ